MTACSATMAASPAAGRPWDLAVLLPALLGMLLGVGCACASQASLAGDAAAESDTRVPGDASSEARDLRPPVRDARVPPELDHGADAPYWLTCTFYMSACGGNVVGAWRYHAGCINPSVLAPIRNACPAATVTDIGYMPGAGDQVFLLRADGTFRRAMEGRITAELRIPAGCTAGANTCTSLAGVISGLMPAYKTRCTAEGITCACTISKEIVRADEGTYLATGGVVLLTIDGQMSGYRYCIFPGALHLDWTMTSLDRDVSFVLVPQT